MSEEVDERILAARGMLCQASIASHHLCHFHSFNNILPDFARLVVHLRLASLRADGPLSRTVLFVYYERWCSS